MIRISPDVLSKIDHLIQTGRYSTRSDFAKTAIVRYLSEIEGSPEPIGKDAVLTAIREYINTPEYQKLQLESLRKAMGLALDKENK